MTSDKSGIWFVKHREKVTWKYSNSAPQKCHRPPEKQNQTVTTKKED